MTSTPSGSLLLTQIDTGDTVRLELRGDLDHHCADVLLDAVTRVLAERTRLRDLHLHCAELAAVDSSGLSTLLMIRRRTGAAGVRLHLDDRPVRLDRILEVTGTLEHLTAADAAGKSGSSAAERRSAASDEPIPVRSSRPDTNV
ncbi:STAS domain-containing protein [Streptomyces sp. NPDC006512]|uniref:STAS domain-containing protein n=1 Tax=Streptomyces sp. NPDC006512 TaxID=3154307 RepID=UPI0033B88AC6